MTQKQKTKLSDLAPTAYGTRAQIESLAKRILAVHPNPKEIGDRGALLLSQLGLSLGLNPLPGAGHLAAWRDEEGELCVHIGISGWEAMARWQSYYSVSTRPMRADEREQHALKIKDHGAIAELYRHDVTREEVELKLEVKPVIGVGIVRAGERIPRGRSLAWKAAQRATVDALRSAYSLKLPDELVGELKLANDAHESER